MRFTDAVMDAMRNVLRNKFQMLISILGISIGIASVITIAIFGLGGKSEITTQLESLGVSGVNITPAYTDIIFTENQLKMVETILSDKQVKVIPVRKGVSSCKLKNVTNTCMYFGGDSNFNEYIEFELLYGRTLNSGDIKNKNKVVVIDVSTAKAAYHRENVVGKQFSLLIGGNYEDFTIVGVGKPSSAIAATMLNSGQAPSFAFLPYSTIVGSNGMTYDQFVLKTEDGTYDDILTRLGILDEHIYHIENNESYSTILDEIINNVTILIAGIAAVSLFVGGFGIMSIMLSSVNERKREIGIKKAIGASNKDILTAFLLEAILLTMTGSVVGMTFGIAFSYCATEVLQFPFTIPIDYVVGIALFSVSIGIVSGIFPAYRAGKLSPLEALNQE